MPARADGRGADGRCRVRLGDFELAAARGHVDARGDVKITIRPERVQLEAYVGAGGNRVPGMVQRGVYVGSAVQLIVHLAPRQTLQASVQKQGGALRLDPGAP